MLKYLTSINANVNTQDNYGRTALMIGEYRYTNISFGYKLVLYLIAIQKLHVTAFNILLNNPSINTDIQDMDGYTALIYGNLSIGKHNFNNHFFKLAVNTNQSELITSLIIAGADTNLKAKFRGKSALIFG